jgi:pyrroline-5-carboxylate reductase
MGHHLVMARLVVVGGGKMGEALLKGLVAAGWASPEELAVVEPVEERRSQLAAELPGVLVAPAHQGPSDGALIAVKPQHVAEAVDVAVSAGAQRVLSIAAGVTLAQLELAAGAEVPVVRAMPNTPALVGAGAAAVAGGSAAGDDDVAWAEGILAAVGEVVRVPEPLLDAVTGLSGSGPAYVFLIAESLVEAGVLNGLPRDVATTLAQQTLLGSARLLAESDDDAAQLRAAVTSPGGTTAAGLHALESAGVRAAILDAVTAATERSKQLAQG